MSELVAKIPQRLLKPTRFLFWDIDELVAFGVPAFLGLFARVPFMGLLFGVILFSIWRRLKGNHGISGLLAWAYWWVPDQVSPFRHFPPSHISDYEG